MEGTPRINVHADRQEEAEIRRRALLPAWSSGLCDCCIDFTSCLAVIACAPTIAGQLVERLWRRKFSCIVFACLLWAGACGNFIVNWFPATYYYYETEVYAYSWYALVSAAATIFLLAMWILTAAIRSTIRTRDSLPAVCCSFVPWLEDLALSVLCLCCVQSQIMRHEGMTQGRYKLCSADGGSVASGAGPEGLV
jgi:Cys-rich protein (TIGR01571 family)